MYNGKEIIRQSMPAFYCENCNLYFMFNNTYEKLKRKGNPLCKIYVYEKYIQEKNCGLLLNQESELHSFGYNVNATENLSERQRQKILAYIIENGYMKKTEIISLLNYFIETRKNQINMKAAIKKWNQDIEYLNNLKVSNVPKVNIGTIKIYKSIKVIK